MSVRTFFALDISPQDKIAIDEWRHNAFGALPEAFPVAVANLHITLAFLGQTDDRQLEQALAAAQDIAFKSMTINCDHVGYWSKPRVLWLGCQNFPELDALASQLQGVAKSLKLNQDTRRYHPHISLYRKLKTEPPAPIIAPDFALQITSFSLYHSFSSSSGLVYKPIQTFTAPPF